MELTLILGLTAIQLIMWMTAARAHYRHFAWARRTLEEDRRFFAALLGFIWPLTLAGWGIGCACRLIGWVITRPTLAEMREAHREQKHERLQDLDRQIKTAETELEEVTRGLEN